MAFEKLGMSFSTSNCFGKICYVL